MHSTHSTHYTTIKFYSDLKTSCFRSLLAWAVWSECLQQDKGGFVPANIHTTRKWHHSCECDCGESGLNPYGVCVCVRECDSVVWSHTSVGIRFSFLLAIHFHTLFSSRTSITLWRWHESLTVFKQTHKNSMCKICVKTISVNMYLLLSDIESIH